MNKMEVKDYYSKKRLENVDFSKINVGKNIETSLGTEFVFRVGGNKESRKNGRNFNFYTVAEETTEDGSLIETKNCINENGTVDYVKAEAISKNCGRYHELIRMKGRLKK